MCSATLGPVEDEQRMVHETLSLSETEYAFNIRQCVFAAAHANYEQTAPRIKMLVGSWYVDEFGNPTRQIQARD
jgi:hypothetical protein